jgi:hypothetical protein
MEFAITLAEGARITALNKALAAYNASHYDAPLSATQFVQKMVDGQVNSLVASYLVTTVSRLAFMQRFTAEERVAIRTAAQSSPAIEDYLQMLNVSEQVDLTHALTVSGVQQLEAAGLIAAGRAAEILAL